MTTTKLANMNVADLRKRHKELTGRDNKSSNKEVLIKAIKDAEEANQAAKPSSRRGQIAAAARGRSAGAHEPEAGPAAHPPENGPAPAESPAAIAAREEDGETAGKNVESAAPPAVPEGALGADVDAPHGSNELATATSAAQGLADQQADLDDEYELELRTEAAVDGADGPTEGGAEGALGEPVRQALNLRGKSVDELRAIFVHLVGSATDSFDAAYLRWQIRRAEKGTRAPRRFEGASDEKLASLYEEKVRRAPNGLDREGLVTGILAAEREAARAAKRFADVTVGDLQKRVEEVTGQPTETLVREELIFTILEAEKARPSESTRQSKAPREVGKRRIPVPYGMYKDSRERLDKVLENSRYSSRVEFLDECVHEKLVKMGEHEVAALFAR